MNNMVVRDCRCPVCGAISGQEAKNANALAGWQFVADMVEAMLLDKQARRARQLNAPFDWGHPPPGGAA